MSQLAFHQCSSNDSKLAEVLDLIQSSFAFMDARIDPPSSMHQLTIEKIAEHCETGEVWCLGDPVAACLFLSERDRYLYLGKLAVAAQLRGKGIARCLVEHAEHRARAKGFVAMELEVRIELTENHATFEKLGFRKTSDGAHEGYERSTFITMRKDLMA